MTAASEVVGKVGADITGLRKGYGQAKEETTNLSNHFKKTMKDFFGFTGSILAASGIQLGIQGIVSTMKSWVDGAIQAQQNQAALNAVLRSTHDAVGMSAGQINQMVQSLKNLTGVDDDVIMQGTNMLLTFTNIGSSVFPQANQAMLDMAVAMNHGSLAGLDLKDTSIQLGKALNDPIAGISALSRVGVTFTDQQKKDIKAMMDKNDIAGAQTIILKELSKEFGGAAKAAGDADPFNRWNLAVGDLGKTVGALVLPMLTNLANLVTPLAQWVGDHLPAAFDQASGELRKFGDILAPFIDTFNNVRLVLEGGTERFRRMGGVLDPLLRIIGTLRTIVLELFDGITKGNGPFGALHVLALEVFDLFRDLAKTIWTNLQPAFKAISGVVSDVVGWLGSLSTKGGQASGIINQIGTIFAEVFKPISTIIGDLTKDFSNLILVLLNQGQQSFNQMKTDWLPIISSLVDWFKNQMLPAIMSLIPPAQALIQTIITKGVPAFFAIKDAVSHVVSVIVSLFLPVFKAVEPIIARVAGWLLDMGDKALKFLLPQVQNATKAISQFADEMKQRLEPFIQNVAKGIRQAADVIGKIWGALWPWISSIIGIAWDLIKTNLTIIWDGIKLAFRIGADIVTGKWDKIWTDIKDAVSGVWKDLQGILGGLWANIQGAFQAASMLISNAWNNWIVQPIKDAVQNAIAWIEGLWQQFIDWISGKAQGGAAHPKSGPPTRHGGRGMGGYEEGGTMSQTGMAWVGEDKPELVFGPRLVPMLAGTRILNGQDTQAALGGRGGGNTYNYTTNLNGPTTEEVVKLGRMDQQRRAAYYGR